MFAGIKRLLFAAGLGAAALAAASPAEAQANLENQFIGEIRFFAGNYAPYGWERCDGQLLSIAENQALFSVIGTLYGGDGVTTFALPDMRGRFPIHAGQGVGLTEKRLGEKSGMEVEWVGTDSMPAHTHSVSAAFITIHEGDDDEPVIRVLSDHGDTLLPVGSTGSSETHNNMPPYLGVNCIIATIGSYPPRN